MAKKLSEDFVRNSVIRWLKQKGYDKDLKVKSGKEPGVDIKVRNNLSAEEFFVETKGDPDKPGTRTGFFLGALGQIITRMKPEAVRKYAIAFPKSYSEIALSRISWEVCKKLNLEVLLVNENGEVEEKTWEDIKLGYYREVT